MRCCSRRSGSFCLPPPTRRCRCAPPANGRRRRARWWSRIPNCATSRCSTASRESGHRFEQRNFANIVYEYSVSGQKLRNNRVSIGEDRGNFQVAETIARYPVGTASSPSTTIRCIRARRCWSATCRRACGAASASERRSCSRSCSARRSACSALRNLSARGSPIRKCRCRWWRWRRFGLVAALFALVLRQQSARAKTWPVVPGTIKLSGLEQYRAARKRRRQRGNDV